MPRKLKVFQAQLGFYDTVVAAASQAAALRAWGSHQNLFADGTAQPATDEAAIEAALANPDVPLRRGVGTNAPFSLNPGLPHLPDLPARSPKPKPTPAVTARPKPTPPPDRSKLAAAEKALHAMLADQQREAGEFGRRREALEAEEQAAEQRWSAARAKADAAVERERQAYKATGGRL